MSTQTNTSPAFATTPPTLEQELTRTICAIADYVETRHAQARFDYAMRLVMHGVAVGAAAMAMGYGIYRSIDTAPASNVHPAHETTSARRPDVDSDGPLQLLKTVRRLVEPMWLSRE